MRADARRMLLTATAENASRWCRVGFRIRIDGPGEMILPDALMFGIAFSEPPWVSVGADMAGMSPWQLKRTSTADQLMKTNYVVGALPSVTAVVTDWICDTTGKFVTGAKVAVYCDTGASTVPMPVTAHIMFQGEGLKTFQHADSV
jgi:hypothetical protein